MEFRIRTISDKAKSFRVITYKESHANKVFLNFLSVFRIRLRIANYFVSESNQRK